MEQWLNGIALPPRPRLALGPGALDRVGELARELGGRRVLLVTDKGIVAAGHADRATRGLQHAGLTVLAFDAVHENPTTDDADACLAVARQAAADLIVGLGGGSAMDTAKAANFLLTNGGTMRDYWGVGKAAKPMLPLIAVPTTAGTGSECQSFALISDPDTHQKMACGDPKALPAVAVLDPDLTRTQPPAVAANTGLDALAHAVETAVTTRRNDNSVSLARRAFALARRALPRVLAGDDDDQTRAAMQLAAALAGMAIEQSMLGAAHSAANPLTAHYGIVHGRAVGLMLPHVVRFNAADPDARDAYARLITDTDELPDLGPAPEIPGSHGDHPVDAADPADALAAWIESLLDRAAVPRTLEDHGVPADAIAALADEAAQQWTAQFNPRPVDASAFAGLYESCLTSRVPR